MRQTPCDYLLLLGHIIFGRIVFFGPISLLLFFLFILLTIHIYIIHFFLLLLLFRIHILKIKNKVVFSQFKGMARCFDINVFIGIFVLFYIHIFLIFLDFFLLLILFLFMLIFVVTDYSNLLFIRHSKKRKTMIFMFF